MPRWDNEDWPECEPEWSRISQLSMDELVAEERDWLNPVVRVEHAIPRTEEEARIIIESVAAHERRDLRREAMLRIEQQVVRDMEIEAFLSEEAKTRNATGGSPR